MIKTSWIYDFYSKPSKTREEQREETTTPKCLTASTKSRCTRSR